MKYGTRALATLLTGMVLSSVAAVNLMAEDLSFTVTNTTDSAIKKILVSEDGKKWGYFDIGAGIGVKQQVTLVWGAHTNNEDCKEHIKAVFADGSESEPVIFDFCEKNLELEF